MLETIFEQNDLYMFSACKRFLSVALALHWKVRSKQVKIILGNKYFFIIFNYLLNEGRPTPVASKPPSTAKV